MLGLGAPGELALGELPAGAAPESAQEAKFHQGWSEPVREKIARSLAVALIASGATVPPIAPFPEAVAQAKWHQPLSEPVRVRPALPTCEQQFLAFHPRPIVAIGWFGPLAEPARARPAVRVPAQEQQFQPFDEDIIFVDRWFAWWSQPTRVKPALGIASQQALAFAPQPLPLPGGGGGWRKKQPAYARTVRHGSKKQGAPRQVEPPVGPPTFAQAIAAHEPAQLADVLGARFAAHLPQLGPPALDLWAPSRPAPVAQKESVPPPVIDEIQDRLDAMEALRVLDDAEQERKAEIVAMLLKALGS